MNESLKVLNEMRVDSESKLIYNQMLYHSIVY